MKKKILVVCILGMFLLVSISVTGLKSITDKLTPKNDDYTDYLPVMRPTPETLKKWEGALLICFYAVYTVLKLLFFQL